MTRLSTHTSPVGFERVFAPGELTLGVFFAIESYAGPVPTMEGQIELARRAEELGFAALWVRDVPLHDPTFGDLGQIYDPWVWLGYVAAHTRSIALATGAIIMPLRHPLHTAKAAASVDQLSGGRLVLGVAAGDRPVEFPAFGRDLDDRGELFRESVAYFRTALERDFPLVDSPLGRLTGADLVPKPTAGRIPTLVTGTSRQSLAWIAANADGWITYPRPLEQQRRVVAGWKEALQGSGTTTFKPIAQSLYVDLTVQERAPTPIHLGFRSGPGALTEHLEALRLAGMSHVILNLKYGGRPAADVLEQLGEAVLPHFRSRREP